LSIALCFARRSFSEGGSTALGLFAIIVINMRTLLTRLIRWIRDFIKKKLHSQNEELPFYITMLIAGIVFIVVMNVFVELTDELAENELGPFDRFVTDLVMSFRSPALTTFFRYVTELGDVYAYIVISVLIATYFFVRHRSWRFILQTMLVMALSTLSNVVLKKFINRERPAQEHLVTIDTLSYPSGHSMSAMAFYGFLIYLSFQWKMPRVVRAVLVVLLVTVILSIGTSRIYLGVHFPSDVAAGYTGGLIWITFCIVVFNVTDMLRQRRKKLAA
jgi:membrane-associated phospholipid phosphatase